MFEKEKDHKQIMNQSLTYLKGKCTDIEINIDTIQKSILSEEFILNAQDFWFKEA